MSCMYGSDSHPQNVPTDKTNCMPPPPLDGLFYQLLRDEWSCVARRAVSARMPDALSDGEKLCRWANLKQLVWILSLKHVLREGSCDALMCTQQSSSLISQAHQLQGPFQSIHRGSFEGLFPRTLARLSTPVTATRLSIARRRSKAPFWISISWYHRGMEPTALGLASLISLLCIPIGVDSSLPPNLAAANPANQAGNNIPSPAVVAQDHACVLPQRLSPQLWEQLQIDQFLKSYPGIQSLSAQVLLPPPLLSSRKYSTSFL